MLKKMIKFWKGKALTFINSYANRQNKYVNLHTFNQQVTPIVNN